MDTITSKLIDMVRMTTSRRLVCRFTTPSESCLRPRKSAFYAAFAVCDRQRYHEGIHRSHHPHTYCAFMLVAYDAVRLITENSTSIRSVVLIAQIINGFPAQTANETINMKKGNLNEITAWRQGQQKATA